MIDVETIFDSDREEYEFMQEKKEQPMNETKLKPCPFCGCKKVKKTVGYSFVYIMCEECEASISRGLAMGKYNSIEDAKSKLYVETINAWNRRATDEKT